jgi:hypothetical protein
MAPLMLATIMVDDELDQGCDQRKKKLGYFPFTLLTLSVNPPLF